MYPKNQAVTVEAVTVGRLTVGRLRSVTVDAVTVAVTVVTPSQREVPDAEVRGRSQRSRKGITIHQSKQGLA